MNRRLGRILVHFLLLSSGFAESSPAWEWSLLNGFDGAEILSMASGEGVIMAATRTRGVYRSDDSGKTWQPHGTTAQRFHFLEYDSASHRFYGLGDSSLYAAEPQAREWIKLTDYSPDIFGFVDYSQPGGQTTARFSVHGRVLILLNSQSAGVRVSRDGGSTWKLAGYPTVGLNILDVLAADSCVYASDMDSPVSVSCDGGTSWRFVGGDSTTHYGYGLARHANAVLVASGSGVFGSSDGGRTWTPRNGNLQEIVEPGNTKVWGLKTKGRSIYAVKWDFVGNVTKSTLHRSTDGGADWSNLGEIESKHPIIWSSSSWMEVAEMGTQLFRSSPLGVLRSADGGAAWSRARGLGDSEILSLSVRGRHFLALTGKGLFLTADSGATWDAPLRNDSSSTWATLAGDIGLYAVLSKEGGVRVSTDSGATWKTIPLPAQGPAQGLAVLGRNLFLVSAGGLWRSGPEGTAWTEIPLPAADTLVRMAGGTGSLLLCARRHVWEYREDSGFLNRNGSLSSFDIPRAWMIGVDAYIVSSGELHGWEARDGDCRRITGYSGYSYTLAGWGSSLAMGTNASPQISLDGGKSWEATPVEQSSMVQRSPGWLPFTFSLDGGRLYGGDGGGGIWKLGRVFSDPVPVAREKPRGSNPSRGATGIHALLEARNIRLDGRAK